MNTRLKAPPVKLPADYEEEAKEKKPFIDRRRFMNYTGWLGVLGSIAISLLGFLRFMFPRVLFEPPTVFKAGKPAELRRGRGGHPLREQRARLDHPRAERLLRPERDMHPSGMHAEVPGLRGQVQVPVPRERIPPKRRQLRGPGPRGRSRD